MNEWLNCLSSYLQKINLNPSKEFSLYSRTLYSTLLYPILSYKDILEGKNPYGWLLVDIRLIMKRYRSGTNYRTIVQKK